VGRAHRDEGVDCVETSVLSEPLSSR
jgi:hypothetical protein